MKIRQGDNVIIIRGRDRGRTARVQQVFSKDGKVIVEGINQVTRHMKPTGGLRQGGPIRKEMPLYVSSVQLICPSCNKPSRVGYKVLADQTKARFCKKCQETIE